MTHAVGPILAVDPQMHSLEQAQGWYRARARTAYMSAARGKIFWVLALYVFNVAILAMTGYPTVRVVLLAGTFSASYGMFVFWLKRTLAHGGPLEVNPRGEVAGMVPRFVLLLVSLVLTGGIRSPLLPAMLLPLSDVVIKNGWSSMVRGLLAAVGVSLFAMALLPTAWFGPDVPQPAYWMVLLSVLVTAGAWHTRYAVLLTRIVSDSACDLGSAREEMVYRALTRARELEQVGLKLSHELKNPLAAIKGLVQLSARAACDPDSAEQLRVVAAEVDRMEGILKEYLSFSRPVETLQPKRVALGALADEVLSLMDARAATAGVELRRRGDALIDADPRRLKDALFNLIGNAVEATPEGGKIEIEIDELDKDARIAVRDSGCGMSADTLSRLGTPFFTTRDEGTGLGVVVARATFTQHGGSLVYTSEAGRGTTAVGTLPLKRSINAAGAPG
ncbi:MAG TPA: HAMP domain-containing sensor histidine kinase [Myxococcales bacterium]|jgi:signal transduction histidine kinase|nr:HAMP domain-containing sensor histidine kinase [Myxococcales bacterium]